MTRRHLQLVTPRPATLEPRQPLDKTLHAAGVEALSALSNLVVRLREEHRDEAARRVSLLHQRLAETMSREVGR